METLKTQILAEKGKDHANMTHKQGSLLFGMTRLKFWQPESMPPPNVAQASLLIGACLEFCKGDKSKSIELKEAIQIWFPEFEDVSQIHFTRGGHRKKSTNDDQTPEPDEKPDEKPTKSPKPQDSASEAKQPKKPTKKHDTASEEKQPEPKPAPKPEKPAKKVYGAAILEALIDAGITNIWLVGPAGCGKTTISNDAGEHLGLPVTVVPCGAGTSATTFLGYKYPERESTPFVSAFSQPGIIVLDEFTALEAQVAQIVNGALANNELSATTGTFKRHPECVIIATSNTFGHGADRMYVSNNQLDSSTIDRFAGGIIEVDYSKEYESQYNKEVCEYVWHLRDVIQRDGLRKVASTRAIIAGEKLKAAGLPWRDILTANWSTDEKALV